MPKASAHGRNFFDAYCSEDDLFKAKITFFGRLGCFHFADGKQHGALVKHLPDSSWNMTNTGSLEPGP